MISGVVLASRVVKMTAKMYSFQANTSTNIAEATMPWAASGSTTLKKRSRSVARAP